MSSPDPNTRSKPEGQNRSTVLVGRDDAALKPRIERFTQLLSAYRALSASAVGPRSGDETYQLATSAKEILTRLATLQASAEEISQSVAEMLPTIDAQLGAIATNLRASVENVSMAQLRSTMPEIADAHRKEVVAVLEEALKKVSSDTKAKIGD
jgi:hypothetical protein